MVTRERAADAEELREEKKAVAILNAKLRRELESVKMAGSQQTEVRLQP